MNEQEVRQLRNISALEGLVLGIDCCNLLWRHINKYGENCETADDVVNVLDKATAPFVEKSRYSYLTIDGKKPKDKYKNTYNNRAANDLEHKSKYIA